MDPPPPAAVVGPPAPAAAGGGASAANAGRPVGLWWLPVVSRDAMLRAHIGMAAAAAAAAAAFALFSFTLKPATFPHLPPECDTSVREILELRYLAWVLLLCATAQAGAATAALVVVPPSRTGRVLAFFANLLALLTLGNLAPFVLRALYATGVLCLTGHARTVELNIYAILAYIFLYATPLLWFLSQ